MRTQLFCSLKKKTKKKHLGGSLTAYLYSANVCNLSLETI